MHLLHPSRLKQRDNSLTWQIALVFGTSLVVTASFWGVLPNSIRTNEGSDYLAFYEPVARSVLAGNGLVLPDGTPGLAYPPGYPLLLAGLFRLAALLHVSEASMLEVAALIGMALSAVLVFLLARSIWAPHPALFAALVWITYPFALWLTKQPNSEIPFMIVLYASLLIFWGTVRAEHHPRWRYLLVGVLIGVAMLIRPIGIGLGVILSIFLWSGSTRLRVRQRLGIIGLLLMGNLLAIAPWQAWIYTTTGQTVVLSNSGITSIRDGLTFAAADKGYRQDIAIPSNISTLMQDLYERRTALQSPSDIALTLLHEAHSRPLVVAGLLALKAARSWYATDSGRYELPVLAIQLLYMTGIIWSSYRAWKLGGEARKFAVGIWVLAGYFWVMTTMVLSILRYMVPAIGLLFVLFPAILRRTNSSEGEEQGLGIGENALEFTPPPAYPLISVIMPIRNEADAIERSLGSVLAQDYPPECLEILVVDGMSDDHTREIVMVLGAQTTQASPDGRPVLTLLDNPARIVPAAMNIGLRQARGEIIVRVDGHCTIATDYLRRCVEALETSGAACVGGPMTTVGETLVAQAIALAQSSRFGVGGVAFRTGRTQPGYVDTVAFGAYRRAVFEQIGGFDEELVRNQDDELNVRLLQAGGRIWLDPHIRSLYYSRASLRGLWRQYFQYGFYKVRVMQKRSTIPAWRHIVPAGFVIGLLGSLLLAIATRQPLWWLMVLVPYVIAVTIASLWAARSNWRTLPILPLAFATLHLSYGLGFLGGLWHWRGPFEKRIFDIVGSSVALVLLAPFFLPIALAIKLESRGPVFYKARRVGKGGRPFLMYKFRSMHANADRSGPALTYKDDPRITTVGRFLRSARIDELPQLLNVLKGDMSLVGPRPEAPSYVDLSDARWQRVLTVRPGICGLAQLTYAVEEAALLSNSFTVDIDYVNQILPNKLEHDLQYIDRQSLLFDIQLILRTLALLIRHR